MRSSNRIGGTELRVPVWLLWLRVVVAWSLLFWVVASIWVDWSRWWADDCEELQLCRDVGTVTEASGTTRCCVFKHPVVMANALNVTRSFYRKCGAGVTFPICTEKATFSAKGGSCFNDEYRRQSLLVAFVRSWALHVFVSFTSPPGFIFCYCSCSRCTPTVGLKLSTYIYMQLFRLRLSCLSWLAEIQTSTCALRLPKPI